MHRAVNKAKAILEAQGHTVYSFVSGLSISNSLFPVTDMSDLERDIFIKCLLLIKCRFIITKLVMKFHEVARASVCT